MQWRKAVSCFGLLEFRFSWFWEFLHTSPCLCNSAKHHEARASIFSNFFFFLSGRCCWVYPLVALSFPNATKLIWPQKLTLPRAGFWLHWWAYLAGVLDGSRNISPSWEGAMQERVGVCPWLWKAASPSLAYEFSLFICHRSQQNLSHFPIPWAVQKSTNHCLMLSFKCFSF